MSMLQQCYDLVDQVEDALGALHPDWEARSTLYKKCSTFREACTSLGKNRGLDGITVAFIGPKKAGKSTLLSQLVINSDKLRRLRAGRSSSDATEKLVWIGDVPDHLDSEFEEGIPCPGSDLLNLGFPYTLIDVPGFNEVSSSRGEAASRALDNAAVKVLVVERRTLEDAAIGSYVGKSDGATIIPVINFVRDAEEVHSPDFQAFFDRLCAQLPHAVVLPPLVILDGGLVPNQSEEAVMEKAKNELALALKNAVGDRSAAELADPQLADKYRRFRKEIGDQVASELPATKDAIGEIHKSEQSLPNRVLEHLLGADVSVRAGLRQRLRAVFLERTPLLFFPWRTAASLGHMLQGALDRVPLMMMGSIPSLLSAGYTVMKNSIEEQRFVSSLSDGVKQRAETLSLEELHPQMEHLHAALKSDLRVRSKEDSRLPEVNFAGIDALQLQSSAIVDDSLEKHAISRGSAGVFGLLGLIIFWGIFGWPVYALYQEYFAAIESTLGPAKEGIGQYPHRIFSMLLTSLLLALLPMGIFLIFVLSMAAGRFRVERCLKEVRSRHHEVIADLTRSGLLKLDIKQPQLNACLFLLGLSADESS